MRTEEQLEWEALQRPRAAVAAILGGLLSIGGGIFNAATFSGVPRASVLTALERAAEPGPVGSLPSLRIPLYEWYSDHSASFLVAAGLSAAGAVAIALTLTFLAFATGARKADFPRLALYVPVVGGALMAVALLLVAAGSAATVGDVLDGRRTVDAVASTGGGSLLTAGQLIEVAGRFALGAGFVLVCLHAMRVGLLTRFLGMLGIIAGLLLALPIFGSPIPVVQSFWLLTVGVLLAGRWPAGMPPAWRTGRAEPWPTAAEVRAQRELGASAPAAQAADDGEEPPSGVDPHPSSKKKRKRRR